MVDLAFLEGLLDLVGRAPISELELARDGWRIRVVKAGRPEAALADPAPNPTAGGVRPPSASAGPDAHVVEAGLVGTFYRGPAPGQAPFVEVGAAVSDGDTLGLIEAMKTLIPVQADRDGRIEAILKQDGEAVAAGEPLFRIAAGP